MFRDVHVGGKQTVPINRVLILYRNFNGHHHHSHHGLGVNGLQTARVLRNNGIPTDLAGIWEPKEADIVLGAPDYTHCVIEAPWISTQEMKRIIAKFPRVQFVVRCHSQIGFLQVEAGAITIFREAATLESGSLNFRIAGNSHRFTSWFTQAYRYPCLCLPNLYDLSSDLNVYRTHYPGHTLRIGSFGALRLMKNHTTAAAAAMLIARRRRASLEFHVNVNRQEAPGSQNILNALTNMFSGLTWAKLVQVPWTDWASFRNTVGIMDLCIQLSQSETFNLVTADAAAERIPSVVSDAIEWVPRDWISSADSAEEAARIGDRLISDPHAGQDGYNALAKYAAGSIDEWKHYLSDSNIRAAHDLPNLNGGL